jgi:hypothetical protein
MPPQVPKRGKHVLGLEQDGPESCQRAVNSSFVMITVPVRVVGDGDRAEVSYHWRVGSFAGRDTPLTLEKGMKTSLFGRIPEERFQTGEPLEVVVSVPRVVPRLVLWSLRYEISGSNTAPRIKRLED